MGRGDFSHSIKEDLIPIMTGTDEEVQSEIVSAVLCAGTHDSLIDGKVRILSFLSDKLAERMREMLERLGLRAQVVRSENAGKRILIVIPKEDYSILECLLNSYTEEDQFDRVTSSVSERRAALRGAFLASGYASEPVNAYQIEITVRMPVFSGMLMLLLHAENIEPSVMIRNGKSVLYFKGGGQIADFLAVIGAHQSLRYFQRVRADKEIRNLVNRVVNCDTANAKRQADAGARRGELMKELLQSGVSANIPQELQTAARVLIENPGLSLKDLGEMMNPPISKSGMYHRLQKLEEIAAEMHR